MPQPPANNCMITAAKAAPGANHHAVIMQSFAVIQGEHPHENTPPTTVIMQFFALSGG